MTRLLILLWAVSAYAAVVPITDTLYTPFGGTFNGTLVVSGSRMKTSDGRTIAAWTTSFVVTNGVPSPAISLEPNASAEPSGTFYSVRYVPSAATYAGAPWVEMWVVPVSEVALKIHQVRIVTQPTTSTVILPAQISGGTTIGHCILWNGSSAYWGSGCTGAGGSATASNVGSVGIGVFKQKVVDNFEFYKLNPANNLLSIALNGTDRIDLTINEGNFTSFLRGANNLNDLANVVTARGNLGLGGAALLNVGTVVNTVAAGDHGHTASAITNVPAGNISAVHVQAAIAELDTEKEPANANIQSHISSIANPHSVTKAQVGLGNVSNDAQLKLASNLFDLANIVTARTNLGLGSIATQGADNVAITGGAVSGTALTLIQGLTPAPTVEGRVEWKTDTDQIKVGDGVGTKVFSNDAVVLARANHTGTQLAATVSDFNTAVASTAALKANNLSDLANAATARTNLGLGNSATRNVGTLAGDVATGDRGVTNGDAHNHDGGDGGQIAYNSLSGTPSLNGSIQFVLDGGGSAITTGAKGWIRVPFPCTITSWELTADQSGSIVLDLWKDTYAAFPPTVLDTITAAVKPTLSATQKATGSPTGWTTVVAAGDYIRVNVDSAATVTYVVLSVQVTKQ